MERPPVTTFDYLNFHAVNTPDRLVFILDDAEITYSRFANDALRFTKALADLGVRRGQIVAIHHPHFYIAWLLTIACDNLGAVSTTDDAKSWQHARFLYDHVDIALSDSPVEGQAPFRHHRLSDDWVHTVLAMDLAAAASQALPLPEWQDPVRISRSSGTTGIPKLICVTRQIQELRLNEDILTSGLNPDSRMLIIGAVFGINSMLRWCLICFKVGALLVKVSDRAGALRRHGITHIWALPLEYERLLGELPADARPNPHLIAESAGAAASQSLQERIIAKLTPELRSMMGANEAGFVLRMQDAGTGIPLPGVELEIRDELHRKVPDGTAGLIALRKPGLIDAYFRNEEETRQRFREGWFYTGDAGVMIGPRKVKLLGRADDMVIMGGVKESPLALENTLRTGAGVRDAAVVSIKDSDGGDLVCVALVTEPGADIDRLKAGIHEIWAPYRVRIAIDLMDDLPRTDNGKVSRAKVREIFQAQSPLP
ncbi:MAG: acyl--CoA ligase [Alphaproteobacteria bacterium]|nr:acyl--CoA ligase [Alphaproteobacteria bacterium]